MRILYLTSRLPFPPNRGDRLRVFNFIKSVHRQHEIHLITFISRNEEIKYFEHLLEYCTDIKYIKKSPFQSAISVLFNFWRLEPLQSIYYRSAQMSNLINAKIASNNFDVIYVHLFRMAQFVISYKNQYRILDLTDIISTEIKRSLPYRKSFWKQLYSFEHQRIFNYERKLINLFEETWLISNADQKLLASESPQANIKTVTNGIDINVYHPINIKSIPQRMIFTGHMGVAHNIDAVRFFSSEVFPIIQKLFPECIFVIAGANPSQSVIDLSSQANVEILGFVKDLNYELNRSQVFVAPLRFAAGVQNKVLEAMAAGIPVITTTLVNEGINAKEGFEILIADTIEEYIIQLSKLFNDDTLRMRVGLAGLNFVIKHFSWDFVLQRMNTVEEILSGSRN